MLTSSGSRGRSPAKVSKSLVSSPQYQTSPSLAAANQSSVSSMRFAVLEHLVAHHDASHAVDGLGLVQDLYR